jgi:formylglycine-generating enzyme required for sulfatase activity
MKHVSFRVALATLLFFTATSSVVRGNALSITNVAVQNVAGGTAELRFDLSWSNSWRSSFTDNGGFTFVTNWDAVWVFARQRVSGGDWSRVLLSTNGHTVPSGFDYFVGQNGGVTNPGVMIYRNSEGFGDISQLSVTLRWDYVASGLYGTNQVDYAVFGTEMVYIPPGDFSLGSGGLEPQTFFTYPVTTQPFVVTSESAMVIGTVTGALSSVPGGSGGTLTGTLSNNYPKGYAAIYAMKYEITQGQYVDFLNYIPPGQALARFPGQFGTSRHTINQTGTVYTVTAPDRGCNFLGWMDVVTFLDWAGLRPMTELEFEKICRGFKAPVPVELAFGDITPVFAVTIIGDGTGTDTVTTANANVSSAQNFFGPIRVGIFASSTSTRLKSGAGYFGNMEMSGNVLEMTVTAGDAKGRSFIGEHGDGEVSLLPASWPKLGDGAGIGLRGGSWADTLAASNLRVSHRAVAASASFARNHEYGGRGVRTAP